MLKVGITEKSDPSINNDWVNWTLNKREPTILITKNIKKLLTTYPGIENQNNIIFHASITGYGNTFIEPSVPEPKELLKYLEKISHKERFVIRIDPIIPLENFIERSYQIYTTAIMFNFKRFRISILDLYPHVLKRLDPYHSITYDLKQIYNWDLSHSGGEHKDYMIHAPLKNREDILKYFLNNTPKDLDIEIDLCCEPGMDKDYCEELTKLFNIKVTNNGCISRNDLKLLNIKEEKRYQKSKQREFCNCIACKHELCKIKDCSMNCIYCYWVKELDKERSLLSS
jgi:DNA repair photolyase